MQSQQASLRAIEHKKMKAFMQKGLLLDALAAGNSALATYGNHVGLLCDLAACQYEMGFFDECRLTTNTVHKEYQKCRSILNPQSAKRTSVFLAKLLEETGAVQESLTVLEDALLLDIKPQEKQFIEVQSLRVLSSFGRTAELSKKYSLVCSFQLSDDHVKTEVLHGLMWAESVLFGFNHAINRWKSLCEMRLNPQDQRLIARDFLEIALLSKSAPIPEMRTAVAALKTSELQSFDRFLIELVETGKASGDYSFTQDISFMQSLRILVLQFKYESRSSYKYEIRKKFIYLLSNCSQLSVSILKSWIPESAQNYNLSLPQNESEPSLSIDGRKIQLSKTQTAIICLFREKRNLPLNEVAQSLWQEVWAESHYDRIRMSVYKLNRLFLKELGIEAIKVSKFDLTLSSMLKIS